MTTSEPSSAYVWIWLPGATEPVVCGRLVDGSPVRFVYARSYLEQPDAVPIYGPELPLQPGDHRAAAGLRLPLCIDDAMPDAWGRQVVNHHLGGATREYSEFTYLLQSGSDRIGALDFQEQATKHIARADTHPSLDDLAEAARRIEAGEALGPELDLALLHGSSVGGARPKSLVDDGDRRCIAKFSSQTDLYNVVQGEYVAMALAARCGLDVAPVALSRVGARHVLLVDRFDRTATGTRRRVVSALTVLKLQPYPGGRFATYMDLADEIRTNFMRPADTLRELFGRISFNMLVGNTDDHGRNHAAFVGEMLELTPAFDICPQPRTGTDTYQAMAYTHDGDAPIRAARTDLLIRASDRYLLDPSEARSIIDAQVATIRDDWDEVCDHAELTADERSSFFGRQFLNPSVLTH